MQKPLLAVRGVRELRSPEPGRGGGKGGGEGRSWFRWCLGESQGKVGVGGGKGFRGGM